MPKRITFDEFRDAPVSVPDFAPGCYGMDLTIRGNMDDKEWKRWVKLTSVPELRGMMGKYRKVNGVTGLRNAIIAFLQEQNIEVFDA